MNIKGGHLVKTTNWWTAECDCGCNIGRYFDLDDDKDAIKHTVEREIALHQTLSGCQVPGIIYDVNIHVATIYRTRVTYEIFVRRGDVWYEVVRDNGKDGKVVANAPDIWMALGWATDTVRTLAAKDGVKGVEVHLNTASVITGEGLQGAAPPTFDALFQRFIDRINNTESTKELVKVRLEAEQHRTAFESITTLVDAKLLRQLPG